MSQGEMLKMISLTQIKLEDSSMTQYYCVMWEELTVKLKYLEIYSYRGSSQHIFFSELF